MPQTKSIVSGAAAIAALTGGSFIFNTPSDVKYFDDHRISADEYKFMEYISEFGKSYETVSEFKMRREQFITRHNEIEAWNADKNNTHILGHNKFSDLTHAEMKKRNGYKP